MSVRNGAAEGKGISGDDESGVNRDAEGKSSIMPIVQEKHFPQRQPQQLLQGTVRWERFLPVRSLRVLLVETDDSTRHVVSALLRNCSYEGLNLFTTLHILVHLSYNYACAVFNSKIPD